MKAPRYFIAFEEEEDESLFFSVLSNSIFIHQRGLVFAAQVSYGDENSDKNAAASGMDYTKSVSEYNMVRHELKEAVRRALVSIFCNHPSCRHRIDFAAC